MAAPRLLRRLAATALLSAAALGSGGAPREAAALGYDSTARWAAHDVAAADLDGDGAPDLLLAQWFTEVGPQRGRVVVFHGDPALPGRWSRRTEMEVDADPESLLVRDLDGNGFPDVATANPPGGTVTLLLQDPLGGFARTDLPAVGGARRIAAADLDGDGLPDLAVVGRRDVVLLLQVAAAPGTFAAPVSVAAGAGPVAVALADVDGDGRTDLVVALRDSLAVLLQDPQAAGTFLPPVAVATVGRRITSVVAADLDGDGRTDLACTSLGEPIDRSGAGVEVLLQDAAGGLVFHESTLAAGLPQRSLLVADMDADGVPDLFSAEPHRVAWYRQDPAARGKFKSASHRIVFAAEGGVALADFDGDGLPDPAAAFFEPFLLRRRPSDADRFREAHRFRQSP